MKFGFRKPKAIAPDVQLSGSKPDSHGHPQHCLNCETTLVGNYCHQCGQSAHTHRMSFRHFLLHDFVHGVWHLDKGFPATLKKAFVHPGKEIRLYLAGKRVGWFSILTMILLLYAVSNYLIPTHEYVYPNEQSKTLYEFFFHNFKWLLLAVPFICSWSGYLIFRRSRLNLSEHTIINCFFLVGLLVISIICNSIPFSNDIWYIYISTSFMVVYLIYGYYGAFRGLYTGTGWSWRVFAHGLLSISLIVLMFFFGLSVFLISTGKKKLTFGIDAKVTDTTSTHVPAAP